MTKHRRTVAFQRHLPPNQSLLSPVGQSDKHTLLPIICAHILPQTRVMSDMWKAYDCLKDEGYTHPSVNHSLNFVDPETCGHTQRNENTWGGVKWSMPRTGTSALWRWSFCKNITKHIPDLYEAKMCRYCSSIVPLYALFVIWSLIFWRKETKYTASIHGTE